MNSRLILRLSSRNVWRHPRRSLLTLLAVTVGLWSSLTLASIARGVSTQMRANALQNLTGHLKIFAPGYLSDPVVDHSFSAITVESDPRIKGVAARVRVPGVIRSERESRGITVVGINPSEERGVSFLGSVLIRGRMLNSGDEEGIVVGEKLLHELSTDIGKKIVILAEDRFGKIAERGFRIIGSFDTTLESTERSFVFIGREVSQNLLSLPNSLSEISFLLNDIDDAPKIVEELRLRYPHLAIEDWRTLDPLVSSIAQIQQGVLSFWFLLVIVTIAIGLMNTMFMAIFERTKELGMLQALGMKPRLLLATTLAESSVLLLLGGALGNALLALSLFCLKDGIDLANFSSGLQHVGVGSTIHPVLRRSDFWQFNVLIGAIGLLSALYPAWRASKTEIAQATK